MRRPLLAALLIAGAAVSATPVLAQFGDIFRDPPPRPPGDVPRGSRGAPDLPPAQPLPPPMNQPPQSRPGAGSIQSQPLPPPPGSAAAPPSASNPSNVGPPTELVRPGEPQQAAPGAPLPGLPPGQRQPRGAVQPANTPQQPADTAPQPGDEIVVQPPAQKIPNPQAVFAGLDKITGRIISFDVNINETVQFGALQVTPRACYTRPPTETPNTDGFIEVDEVTLQGEVRRIFTGWMFATSPGLHAVEHPIYDVWLTDCKGAQPAVTAEAPPAAGGDAPAKPSPSQQRQQRRQQPTAQQQAPQQPSLTSPQPLPPPPGFSPPR